MRIGRLAYKIISASLLVLAGSLLITAAAGYCYLRLDHEQILSIQTASMEPTLHRGDAVLIVPSSSTTLRVGDIVNYRNPQAPAMTITHRIVSLGQGRVTTRGDANTAVDPSVPTAVVVGKAAVVMPGLGSWLDRLHRPAGLIVAVYVPALLLIAYQLRRVMRYLERPYRLVGWR